MTKVKTMKDPSQINGGGSNLGGPTPNLLDRREITLNYEWAKRYLELNGEAGQ